ncbi:MAG: fatty acid desaturase [Coleofasciculaceae cyanobacterium RL_1_1]|nr:fatty acid desaturase [Coleofasciculaceae cyanobacterium RL_1_1]
MTAPIKHQATRSPACLNTDSSPKQHHPPSIEVLVRDLRDAVRDCGVVSPWRGLVRTGVIGVLCLGCVAIAWMFPISWAFVVWSAIAAIFYAFWLVSTHEAIHHTLTGWVLWDETIARVISWPILWAVGTYAELHKLHHSWNGRRLDDPERTEWTQAEYDRADGLTRWYVRHQWAIDVFLFGAIGLVLKTFRAGIDHGWFATQPRSRLRWQLAGDVAGW